jgi:malonate-semialdehyde dehydrogenase (acetylating)/methylmalonate-semialdehyde dehydrogenase
MAISAVVAVGSAADPLVKLLEQKARKIVVGPGDRDGVEMGPLVSAQHRDKVASFIEQGKKEGAKPVLDGSTPPVKEGYFLGTTLFDNVKPGMEIYKNEIFGPVLSVLRVKTLDEAIALVNASPYANGTAIFTESALRERGPGRHGRRERADPGAGGLLFVRRLEEFAVRRPARARHGGREVL